MMVTSSFKVSFCQALTNICACGSDNVLQATSVCLRKKLTRKIIIQNFFCLFAPVADQQGSLTDKGLTTRA